MHSPCISQEPRLNNLHGLVLLRTITETSQALKVTNEMLLVVVFREVFGNTTTAVPLVEDILGLRNAMRMVSTIIKRNLPPLRSGKLPQEAHEERNTQRK